MNDIRSFNTLARLITIIAILTCSIVGCTDTDGIRNTKSHNTKTPDTDLLNADLPNIDKKSSIREEEPKLNKNQMNAKNIQPKPEAKSEDTQPTSLMKPKEPIRAIYVTSNVVNSSRIKKLIHLVDQTELNAMVLDINSGIRLSSVAYRNKKPIFTPSPKKSAIHFRKAVQELKKHKIYLIARITTFKDPVLAREVSAWALKNKNGKVWTDRSGTAWIDPYRQEAWNYILDMADYAVELGFDEVQYDYVRFPENEAKVNKEVAYANPAGMSKGETIRRFLHRASVRSHKKGVRISADVFGMVSSAADDMGIGQSWNLIAKEVDVISPMIYPSHYSQGTWGITYPDLNPGPIVSHALKDATKNNKKLNDKGIPTAKVRPWLQSFTAIWLNPHRKYGSTEIREQIRAARKAGFQSYMLWNSSNRYPVFNTK